MSEFPTGLKRMKGLVAPPTFCPASKLEHSIHKPPRMLRADIELVFKPDLADAYQRESAGAHESMDDWLAERLLAVPTWQPAEQDLSEISFVVNEERRGLLANFHAWVGAVRAKLGDEYWSDASDPLEGTALFGQRTSCIYNELEGLTTLLRYDSVPIGCCGIVLHPEWRRRAYPVTFFTTAPLEVLKAALAAVEAERLASQPSSTQQPAEAEAETEAEAAATGLEVAAAQLQLASGEEAAKNGGGDGGGDSGEAQRCALPRKPNAEAAAEAAAAAATEAEGGEAVELDASREGLGWLASPLPLRTSPAVHFDAANLPLLTPLPRALRQGDALLYHGCGCGVLGLLALRAGCGTVHFADVLPAAVDLAAANARAAGYRQGKHWTAAVEDLRGGDGDGGGSDGIAYDVVLCNPPQLAGPPEMHARHADRYAGPDGLDYYRRLAGLAGSLKAGGRVLLMQTSLSSFGAVEEMFDAAKLPPATLASQPRVRSAAAFEALAPGTFAWLLELRARGGADFRLVDAAGAVLPPRPAADAAHGPTAQELEATLHYTQRLLLCGGGGGGEALS